MVKKRTRTEIWRDKFVYHTCSFLINHVATPWYKEWIVSLMAAGIASLDDFIAKQETKK